MRKLNLRDTFITLTTGLSLLAAGSVFAQNVSAEEQPATGEPQPEMQQQTPTQAPGPTAEPTWEEHPPANPEAGEGSFDTDDAQAPTDGPYGPTPEEEEEEETATGTFGDGTYQPSTEEEEEEEPADTFGGDQGTDDDDGEEQQGW